jgi:queuine tRNA-ribosyltransferase
MRFMDFAAGKFEVLFKDKRTAARCGRLYTAHGVVETPVFMPVGTQATVKTMLPEELEQEAVQIILGNTYHLLIRPGIDIILRHNGLHNFMGWQHPILTDSGGFQVFSLAPIRKVNEDGVEFSSHVDGAKFFLGPREAVQIQKALASDIAMAFDECAPFPCSYEYACQSAQRTLRWALICLEEERAPAQLLFGIVQGSVFEDLRKMCAKEIGSLKFDGFAIGGVSVGEPEDLMLKAIDSSIDYLPENKPRYLMGVGYLRQIVEAVARGVDMFDCVIPTRVARNGSAITRHGRYILRLAKWKDDLLPIEEGCTCPACKKFTRSYVRHLLNCDEILGARLLTIHNIHRYMEFMAEVRESIKNGTFQDFREMIKKEITTE